MQSPSTQTEMFSNVKHLHWLVQTAWLWLLVNDQVNVNIGMDEVAISGPPHRPLDPHQTMFLGPAEHGLGVHDGPVLVLGVGSDPANVLAPSESPVLKTQSTQVQTITTATPEEHKATTAAHLTNEKTVLN